jgi:hypothetical protein
MRLEYLTYLCELEVMIPPQVQAALALALAAQARAALAAAAAVTAVMDAVCQAALPGLSAVQMEMAGRALR